jgi:hypothetical protein
VSTGHVADTALAFVIGAGWMVAAGLVEIFLGGRPEGQSLEDIARPLTADDALTDTSQPSTRSETA